MKNKTKLAELLRRWANKLSPENRNYPSDGLFLTSPFGIAYYKVRRVASAYRISINEEMKVRMFEEYGHTDAKMRMRAEYKQRIAESITKLLLEKGVIEYEEERDQYTQELTISGSLYVGIRDNINNSER